MARLIVICLILCIIVAHVFLWRSDMAYEAKLAFTMINAAGWAIVFAPIFLVDRWLEAVRARNRDGDDQG